MLTEATSPLVIDIAKSFITLLQATKLNWQKGYLRFCQQEFASDIKASVEHGSKVDILDALAHKDFFHLTRNKGASLLASVGRNEGMFLLVVNSNYDYDIQFEYEKLDRWEITKLNDGTGIPTV